MIFLAYKFGFYSTSSSNPDPKGLPRSKKGKIDKKYLFKEVIWQRNRPLGSQPE
jgi:hypothetical protein